MTSSLRYSKVTNATGEVVAPGGAAIVQGQDYALETVDRLFTAADVGVNAGQTQHAAGMIFAEFTGSFVKGVVSVFLIRADDLTYEFIMGNDEYGTALGFNVIDSPIGSTVRLIDRATNDSVQAREGDRMIATFALGNS